jgi:hypothetical protein
MNNWTNILIISRGRLPYSPLSQLVLYKSGNAAFTFFENQVAAPGKTEKFKITPTALQSITAALTRHKFTQLATADSGFLDGDQVQMKVTNNKAHHTVVLTNYRLPAFNKIIRVINRHLPKAFRVYYNQLILK